MIGIYGNDEETRLAHGYNGLVLNSEIYPVEIAVVNHKYDSVTETRAQRDGLEAYEAHRLVTMLQIEGIVRGDSVAQLHDRIEALNAAFDPVLAAEQDADGIGFLPYTFSVPTADTANYANGLIPMQYYVRSMSLPVPRVSRFEGTAAAFHLTLQAADPRRYLQTMSTHTFVSSLSENLDNSLASYYSFPTLTLTMSGAGDLVWAINRDLSDAVPELQLNLSGLIAGDVLVVDMGERTIKLNGVDTMNAYVSGDYFKLHPETQVVKVSSLNGIASAVLSYRRAFV